VNFGIHLPADLDAFAQTRQTSRSSVIREAVREYLARHALQAWPADLERAGSVSHYPRCPSKVQTSMPSVPR